MRMNTNIYMTFIVNRHLVSFLETRPNKLTNKQKSNLILWVVGRGCYYICNFNLLFNSLFSLQYVNIFYNIPKSGKGGGGLHGHLLSQM